MPTDDVTSTPTRRSKERGNNESTPIKGYTPITKELQNSPSFDPISLTQLNANYNKQINSIIQTVDKKIMKDKEKRTAGSKSTKITVTDEDRLLNPKVSSPTRKKTKSVTGKSDIDTRNASKYRDVRLPNGNGADARNPNRKKHRARSDIGARTSSEKEREIKNEQAGLSLDSLGLSWLIPQNFLKNF
jgi:hypothetical protein